MILVSCRIPWLSKALKVILYLKVITISWLKQLDNLNTMVVFVQMEKGLELNYILELHHDTHPPLMWVDFKCFHLWWNFYLRLRFLTINGEDLRKIPTGHELNQVVK